MDLDVVFREEDLAEIIEPYVDVPTVRAECQETAGNGWGDMSYTPLDDLFNEVTRKGLLRLMVTRHPL